MLALGSCLLETWHLMVWQMVRWVLLLLWIMKGNISSTYVFFYDETIGRLTNVNGHQLISIERINHEYIYHDRTAIRRQFPLMQSWACTIHKVKGMAFDEIVVDVGSSVLEPGMAYVALSCNAGKWWTEKNFFRGLSCSIVLTYWYKYHCHV